jgi:iduronate 2-sulfatase
MIRHLLPLLGLAAPLGARPNVLFLAVDDLRPELASFGAEHIQSPAMTKHIPTAESPKPPFAS